MWHDYFKPEHVEKFPDLHDVCWKASKQASQVKRTVDIAEAQKLLDLIDKIDKMWRETGGPAATRLQAACLSSRSNSHRLLMRRPGLLLGAALGVLVGAVARAAAGQDRPVVAESRRGCRATAWSRRSRAGTGCSSIPRRSSLGRRRPASCASPMIRARPQRLIVKRASAVTGSSATLASDHPAHVAAEESIGPVATAEIVGQPWLRYWPLDRFGRVG